jgi:tRNA-splicing ligase RtcB
MISIEGKYTNANIMIDTIDEQTMGQIISFINNQLFTNYVAIMPDTHYGKGAVIGFTMELGDNIIPNVVGVDQSCGVLSFKIMTKYFDNVQEIFNGFDQKVRQFIPMGNKVHKKPVFNIEREFDWKGLQTDVRLFTMEYNKRYGIDYKVPTMDYNFFNDLCKRVDCDQYYAMCSIGSLGGGNHFIEVGKDENNEPWITVHSGSRNLGKKTAEVWQAMAVSNNHYDMKKDITKIINALPAKEREKAIQDFKDSHKLVYAKGLEPLYGGAMFDYLVDSIFNHHYASTNRQVIMSRILSVIHGCEVKDSIHTVHNYINYKDFIIRKGAVSAANGEIFVLPFNLEDGTLICRGKGNPEWNYSAPHGAGRISSRSTAKQMVADGTISEEEVRERLEKKGVHATTLPHDELPEAYKSSVMIEDAIEPTAEIIHRIKPIISFKSKK